jgi:hypothetical protein
MTVATRIKIARVVAISADFLQLGLFPLFAEGIASPLEDVLDLMVCLTLTFLVGWHYSFLPSFVVKVLPVADLVPTWTIAIFLATRQKQNLHQAGATQVYADPPSQPRLSLPPK